MKKLVLMFSVIAIASIASADILYWMVTEAAYNNSDDDVDVYAVYSGNPPPDAGKYLVGSATHSQILDALDYDDPADSQPFQANVGNYTGDGWSYYIELATSGTQLASVTWQQAVNAGYLSSGAMSVPTGINGATAFGGAANVPEPTSGLLFLVGGVLLGLKRRRQQV